MAYGSYQFMKLLQKEDYVVQLRNLENKFTFNETFGSSDQFTVAAGLIDYENSDRFDLTDPEIGELKLYHKYWNNVSSGFNELQTRVCE